MKKTLLLGTALLVSVAAIAGNNGTKAVAIADKGISESAYRKTVFQKPTESIYVGSSANAYFAQSAGTNQIAYDDATGTIVIVKRRGSEDTHISSGSGRIAYHASTDDGATWSLAQFANNGFPAFNGRHPNIAVLSNGKVVSQWAELIGGAFGGFGASVTTPQEDGLPAVEASVFQETLIVDGDTVGWSVPDEIAVDGDDVLWMATQDAVTYNTYLMKSANGVDWEVAHIVADIDNGGVAIGANPARADFFGTTGWYVVGIQPDSAKAVEMELSQGSDAYYPYLVKFEDGDVVEEGILDIYAHPYFEGLGIDTWQFNYDIVTDKDGDFHLFAQLYDYVDDNTRLNHGIYEIFSTDGSAESASALKIADQQQVSWVFTATSGENTRADIDAARDEDGKYVVVKWLDKDSLDPDGSSEIYMTGRPISGDSYADIVALNDNDFAMQYFTQMAPRMTHVEGSTFQPHVLWTDFGTSGDPPAPSGTLPAGIYYLGPQIELPEYTGGQAGGTLTFIVNTAFVQDTVAADNGSTVSIRGGGIFGDWSYDNGVKLTNIGGDYWMGTLTTDQANSGGYAKVVTSTNSGTGWDRAEFTPFDIEGDETIEVFTSGLKVKYPDPVTGDTVTRSIAWNPLEVAKGETNNIAVHFRVNFEGLQTFPRTTAEVYVRGSMLDDSWSVLPEGRLYPEVRHDDLCCGAGMYEADKHFYSRTVLVDPSKTGNREYKFTFNSAGSTTWEEISNRVVNLSGNDTTLAWVYWENKRPQVDPGNALYDINFEVDLFNAISTNGFDPATDNVVVRAGYAASGPAIKELQLDAPLFGTTYTGLMEEFKGRSQKFVAYQYFKVNSSVDQEEFYFDNFDETGTTTGPKFRKIPTPVDTFGVLTASDLLDDAVSTHRMPFFKNSNPVGVATSLVIEANLNPAVSFVTLGEGSLNDIQGGSTVISAANIAEHPLYINGPATGGWGGWNPIALGEARMMSDDGATKGDKVAGDNIWTITLPYEATAIISQEYKFGIGGYDNEAGFGNNHMANLFAQDVNNVEVQFGDIQPSRYVAEGKGYWDFATESWVGVDDGNLADAKEFRLLQNYPNPFNPSTMIPFTVAKAGVVNFTVYNVLGQVVSSFNYDAKSAGLHSVNFQANNLATGSYLVKMTAGNFNKTIKMVFAK